MLPKPTVKSIEKLIFHMQADAFGKVHINSFSAYVGNYDS